MFEKLFMKGQAQKKNKEELWKWSKKKEWQQIYQELCKQLINFCNISSNELIWNKDLFNKYQKFHQICFSNQINCAVF